MTQTERERVASTEAAQAHMAGVGRYVRQLDELREELGAARVQKEAEQRRAGVAASEVLRLRAQADEQARALAQTRGALAALTAEAEGLRQRLLTTCTEEGASSAAR